MTNKKLHAITEIEKTFHPILSVFYPLVSETKKIRAKHTNCMVKVG